MSFYRTVLEQYLMNAFLLSQGNPNLYYDLFNVLMIFKSDDIAGYQTQYYKTFPTDFQILTG